MWIFIGSFLKIWAPIVISVIALYVALRDRRPRLLVRPRKTGPYNPYKLRHTAGGELAFLGGIEVYNLSARPNAVRDYRFWHKKDDGTWRLMESQNFKESTFDDKTFLHRNQTPVTIAPYSGAEIRVLAFEPLTNPPSKMRIRIEVEDLFGKRYTVEVVAEKDS